MIGLAGFAAAAPAAPSVGGSPAAHYRACGFSRVDGWPVADVSVRHVSCAHAKRLLDRYARTNRGLGCEVIGEHKEIGLRCYARVAVPSTGFGRRRSIQAVIVIADLPECPTPTVGCEHSDEPNLGRCVVLRRGRYDRGVSAGVCCGVRDCQRAWTAGRA